MKLKNLLLATILGCSLMAFAVPARRDLRTVIQPDGSTLTVRKIGDEHFHLTLTEDGVPLVKEGGAYCFATLNEQGLLRSTGVIAADLTARNEAQRNAAVVPSNGLLNQAATARRFSARRNAPARVPQTGMGTFTTSFPNKGDVRVLVILVEYTDVKFKTTNAKEYFTNMMTQPGFSQYGGTGSAHEYFIDQSSGEFRPQFDVLGPVTLAHTREYYGQNDPDTKDDMHPEEMIIEAIKDLDPTVDFSVYDNDNDGVIDNVYVFYAGEGEASSDVDDSVWPHSWSLSESNSAFKADGKVVDKYACSNEWETESSSPAGIGTIIHEFSHVMGLPDLYPTDYNRDAYGKTCGTWSVMDYGTYNNDGRTPPNYSAYERNAMQWIEPELIDGPMNCSLEAISESNKAYIVQTSKDNEFFLFENRQNNGWDTYLPSHGMLIWHIDFDQRVFDDNEVNNNVKHMYVRLIKANNKDSEEFASGWTWPGASRNTDFTSETTPAFKDWNNRAIDLPITDIAEKDGVISFVAAGGEPSITAPKNLTATEFTSDSFTLLWDPVEDAEDYVVDITVGESGERTVTTADMGSGSVVTLPKGWTSNSNSKYDKTASCGQAIPALRLDKSAHHLITETFPSDIKKVSFWLKGNGTTDGKSKLEIQYSTGDDNWKTFETFYPSDGKAKNIELTSIPSGARNIRFYYTKSKGNVGIDDVVVECGEDPEPLTGFTGRRTGGKTRLEVSPIVADRNIYSVKLRAVKGAEFSRPVYLAVNTLETGICLTEAGLNAYVSVSGTTVTVRCESPVGIFDLAGRVVAVVPEGTTDITLPAGFYIIAGKKVIVKE